MWKKVAITATALLGMAAPALADEPCERGGYQQTYVQPSYVQPTYVQPTYVQPARVQPTYVQPTFRNPRVDHWRARQWQRWQRMKHAQRMRYGQRW